MLMVIGKKKQLLLQVWIVSIVLIFTGCAYTAMPNMRGSVLDSVTKEPIANAKVDVYGRDETEEHILTDSHGIFALKGQVNYDFIPIIRAVPTLHLRISAIGYEPFDEVSPFGSFDSIHPVTIIPIELTPIH